MSERRALAVSAAGLAAVLSYGAQQAWSGGVSVAELRLVLASEHIPYFWRVSVAVLQGVVAGGLVWALVPEGSTERWLARLPMVGVLCCLALLVVVAVQP